MSEYILRFIVMHSSLDTVCQSGNSRKTDDKEWFPLDTLTTSDGTDNTLLPFTGNILVPGTGQERCRLEIQAREPE